MSIKILAIISFLLPFTVSILGALAIFGNRHKGFSRNLLSIVFLGITYFFAYLVIARLDLDWIQVLSFAFFTPILFGVAPALFLFQKSLMAPNYRIKNGETRNFITTGIVFALTLLTIFLLNTNGTYAIISSDRSVQLEGQHDVIAILIRLVITLGAIGYTYFYLNRIQGLYDSQKKKYKKFYADYEKRNELLGKTSARIWLIILVLESALMWYGASSGVVVIAVKLLDSLGLLIMIKFGIEQIDIRRYRMYKLSSHEHELD